MLGLTSTCVVIVFRYMYFVWLWVGICCLLLFTQCYSIWKDPLQFLFCSAGSMTILPTVLFLITGVLRETAVKADDNSVPVPVSAALQGIKTIITSPLAQVESMHTQWTSLVRSSLASVLEYSPTGEHTDRHAYVHTDRLLSCLYACLCQSLDDSRPYMDEVSMLTAITLFLLSANNELAGVTVLQKGCLDRFRKALNSSDPWVSSYSKPACTK